MVSRLWPTATIVSASAPIPIYEDAVTEPIAGSVNNSGVAVGTGLIIRFITRLILVPIVFTAGTIDLLLREAVLLLSLEGGGSRT